MLQIKWVLLCEDVVTNAKGTGDILGVVEDYVSRAVPFGIGQLAVVLGAHAVSATDCFISVALRFVPTREIVFRSEPPGEPHYHLEKRSPRQQDSDCFYSQHLSSAIWKVQRGSND